MKEKSSSKMEQRFIEAYDRYADDIFRHCYYRLYNDRDKAKEVMQEAYMKTWEYIAGGKKIKNIRAFLYRVATNLIIDHSRKKKEGSLEDMMETGFQPELRTDLVMQDIVDGKDLMRFLDHLEEKYRLAVSMRYIDDLEPKEIAAILDERVNTVSVWIHRGTNQLKELVEDQGS